MSRPINLYQDSTLSGGNSVMNQLDFSTLYDRYAPALLGVIMRIISDENEAVTVLEATFATVFLETNPLKSEKKPVFPWLLSIARAKSLDALNERQKLSTSVFQIEKSGKVIPLQKNSTPAPTPFSTDLTDPRLTALLDSVLYTNCTPEEAATTIGTPVETVRQQLRLAMKQLRASSKG